MNDSLQTLVHGVVDYAGLFPPAKLDMPSAVAEYAQYLDDPARAMLGRFVVPVSRLGEFDAAASAYLPTSVNTPWRLTALVGPDVSADVRQVTKFNERHTTSIGHNALIDALEIRVASAAEIGAAMSVIPAGIDAFFEIPIAADPDELIGQLRRSGGKAKIRTGGVTADAFPDADSIVRFLERCASHCVPFKATAGLHHPIRASYRLTYEPEPPFGVMYGYLNMLVASALAWNGAPSTIVRAALEEMDASCFVFSADGLEYAGQALNTSALANARQSFVTSFGSCSFREPVDELAALDTH